MNERTCTHACMHLRSHATYACTMHIQQKDGPQITHTYIHKLTSGSPILSIFISIHTICSHFDCTQNTPHSFRWWLMSITINYIASDIKQNGKVSKRYVQFKLECVSCKIQKIGKWPENDKKSIDRTELNRTEVMRCDKDAANNGLQFAVFSPAILEHIKSRKWTLIIQMQKENCRISLSPFLHFSRCLMLICGFCWIIFVLWSECGPPLTSIKW